jgi:hypothetical protein
MVNRRAHILVIMVMGSSLAGCGTLDHHQLAMGEFNVWGNGVYAHDTDLQREAARVCPSGYTKALVYDGPANADVAREIFWRVTCSGNSR